MADSQDLEEHLTSLSDELKDTRARRIAAQKSAAAELTLRKALVQAERDRSSSTTEEIESLKRDIEDTRVRFIEKSHHVDLKRIQFLKVDEKYPNNPQRESQISTMNAEARWRSEHNDTEAARTFDLMLAPAKELT